MARINDLDYVLSTTIHNPHIKKYYCTLIVKFPPMFNVPQQTKYESRTTALQTVAGFHNAIRKCK